MIFLDFSIKLKTSIYMYIYNYRPFTSSMIKPNLVRTQNVVLKIERSSRQILYISIIHLYIFASLFSTTGMYM